MPAYGKVKVDTITYDLSGTATDVSVADIATKASPTFTGTINAVNLILSGDLTVNGTTTTIDTTTLQVEDKNIEIGKVSTPSDTTADGGGWTLKGATDKTFNWVNSTDAWTSSEHIHLGDDKKLFFGTGSDFSIYHNGTNNAISTSNGEVQIIKGASENIAKFIPDGAVELYYDNVKVFNTDGNGIMVKGPEGGAANVYIYADEGDDDADKWSLTSNTDGTLTINNRASGSFETNLKLTGNAGVHLYYDNTAVCYTATDALRFNDGQYVKFGNSQDFKIYHNGTHNYVMPLNGDIIIDNGSGVLARISQSGTVSDSKGDLRKIIQNTQGSAYTLVAADAGKHILASGNITIPNSIFSAGDGVVIVNNTSGDLTITSGITNLYLGTDGSTGNKTLASRCTCTVLFTSGTAGYISGGGLS
jgi:hypothetical protein